jgi:hypothetical protein
MSDSDKQQLTRFLQGYKAKAVVCCDKPMNEKVTCLSDLKIEHYNNVCNADPANYAPLCALTAMKGTTATFQPEIDRCCALQSAEKISCLDTLKTNMKEKAKAKKPHQ